MGICAYNLVDEQWIPVLDKVGHTLNISLLECFKNGKDVMDFAVRPAEKIALLRLMLAIGHAALKGPRTVAEISDIPRRLKKEVPEYLAEVKECFWLHHTSSPFLQIASIHLRKGDSLRAFSELDLARASGTASTLFENHRRSPTMSEARKALSLLTFQNFHPGGLLSRVIWDGQKTGRELLNKGVSSSCDAPCITASMVHAFFRGANILQTLKLNMGVEELMQPFYSPGDREREWIGRPIWEKMPDTPEDVSAIDNATRTYVGRLVPLSRAVLLKEEGLLLGDGLTYPHFCRNKSFLPEPTAIVLGGEENCRLLKYDSSYPLWRNLADIFRPSEPGTHDEHVRIGGPITLANIHFEKLCGIVLCAVWRNQKKITDSAESVYTISSNFYSTDGLKIYKEEIEFAEYVFYELLKTIKKKCRSNISLQNIVLRQTNIHFWMSLEQFLPLIFKSIETHEIIWGKKWRQKVKNIAIKIYETNMVSVFSSARRGLYSQGVVALGEKFKTQAVNDRLAQDSSL